MLNKLTVDGKGQVVVVDNTPPSIGGASPEARDNPGTEAVPNGGAASNPGGNTYTPSSGGGTSSGGAVTPSGNTDWSSMLGIYGLPSDVANKVQQIFSSTDDVNQAVALAMAYVRGTQWYAQTYPGIQEGIARGVVSNESDYRSYVNQLQQLNKQYYNTDITSQQITDYLKSGYSIGHVGQLFQGNAYVQANQNDLQYIAGAFGNGRLSQDELAALGNESAGLDSAMGQKIQNLVQKATQKMQDVFGGSLAKPSLSLGDNGLQFPSLAGQRTKPDVSA